MLTREAAKLTPWYHYERPRAPYVEIPTPNEASESQLSFILPPPCAYANSAELDRDELENTCPESVSSVDCTLLPPTFPLPSVPLLKKPIALKREAPDGCEVQTLSEDAVFSELHHNQLKSGHIPFAPFNS
ncbi:hypothetical protein Ciccas_013207 [Cichlidogyrus casuarinus]|uniref:Uncharacterized protein n=1 Tax=Cichlidogyrus casuarinus TaxID=1844966 RepID=A0ABD2PNH7_9PLAT